MNKLRLTLAVFGWCCVVGATIMTAITWVLMLGSYLTLGMPGALILEPNLTIFFIELIIIVPIAVGYAIKKMIDAIT
jgi:hypothetical protein